MMPIGFPSSELADTVPAVRIELARAEQRVSAIRHRLPNDGGPKATPQDQPARLRRKWTINGDFFAFRPSGVARYASEVTRALDVLVGERHPKTLDLELGIVASCVRPDLGLQHIPVRVVPEYNKPRLPQLWVQLQLPRHVTGGLVSFSNLSPVSKRHHIVCVHDLHTWHRPESYGLGFRLAHRLILPIVGHRAHAVTTVSDYSCKELIRNAVTLAENVTVTYNGSDHVNRWDAGSSALEFWRERPFVFCLAQRQRYKNTELIWQIARQLDVLGLDIYVAGQMDSGAMASIGSELPPNVRLLGSISDHDLAKMLGQALCFLFPSRSEGFGLPSVEAMALGCPVVASTSPCLPEICGDAALYADPDDAGAWVEAVRRLKSSTLLREAYSERGRVHARRYSWRQIAEIYLDLMLSVDRKMKVQMLDLPDGDRKPEGAEN